MSIAGAKVQSAHDFVAGSDDVCISEHDAPRVGMIALLCSEAAFFATLIVAYLMFLGQDKSGPTPLESLSWPLAALNSVFLLSSSATLLFASRAFVAGNTVRTRLGLVVTIILGALFLAGTAYEWRSLIVDHGLTIATNLFGTTYYTMIGCHAVHVTVGVVCMTILLGLSLAGLLKHGANRGFELIEWYWHFVDGVWVVLFLIVYVLGR